MNIQYTSGITVLYKIQNFFLTFHTTAIFVYYLRNNSDLQNFFFYFCISVFKTFLNLKYSFSN